MKEVNIKKQYPFQYYTIRNVDLLEQNGFNFDDYSFNVKHEHELYIGNINGLICRHHPLGESDKMMNYLIAGKKLTFLLPENYRECINGLQGFRRSVLRALDAESLKNRITVITYKVDNSDIIDKVTELGKSMKFDVCIMNPPYNNTLHLLILEKVLSFCDKVVNISPYTWAAKRNRWKTTFKKYLHTELVHPTLCEILSHRQSNDVFDLGNQIENLCISVYDRSAVNKLDLLKFNFSDTEYSLYKKVLDDKPDKLVWRNGVNIVTPELHNKTKTFVCPVNIWRGGATCYEAALGSSLNHKKGKIQFQAEFSTSVELENFKQFFQTNFMKWYYKNIVIPSDYKLHMTMFVMTDYLKPWTDERICEFFGITGYIDDNTAEPGSEWEIILTEMKPYTTDK